MADNDIITNHKTRIMKQNLLEAKAVEEQALLEEMITNNDPYFRKVKEQENKLQQEENKRLEIERQKLRAKAASTTAEQDKQALNYLKWGYGESKENPFETTNLLEDSVRVRDSLIKKQEELIAGEEKLNKLEQSIYTSREKREKENYSLLVDIGKIKRDDALESNSVIKWDNPYKLGIDYSNWGGIVDSTKELGAGLTGFFGALTSGIAGTGAGLVEKIKGGDFDKKYDEVFKSAQKYNPLTMLGARISRSRDSNPVGDLYSIDRQKEFNRDGSYGGLKSYFNQAQDLALRSLPEMAITAAPKVIGALASPLTGGTSLALVAALEAAYGSAIAGRLALQKELNKNPNISIEQAYRNLGLWDYVEQAPYAAATWGLNKVELGAYLGMLKGNKLTSKINAAFTKHKNKSNLFAAETATKRANKAKPAITAAVMRAVKGGVVAPITAAGNRVVKGAIMGGVAEAPIEAIQSMIEYYATNEDAKLSDLKDFNSGLWKAGIEGAEGGLMAGGYIGGAVNTAGGIKDGFVAGKDKLSELRGKAKETLIREAFSKNSLPNYYSDFGDESVNNIQIGSNNTENSNGEASFSHTNDSNNNGNNNNNNNVGADNTNIDAETNTTTDANAEKGVKNKEPKYITMPDGTTIINPRYQENFNFDSSSNTAESKNEDSLLLRNLENDPEAMEFYKDYVDSLINGKADQSTLDEETLYSAILLSKKGKLSKEAKELFDNIDKEFEQEIISSRGKSSEEIVNNLNTKFSSPLQQKYLKMRLGNKSFVKGFLKTTNAGNVELTAIKKFMNTSSFNNKNFEQNNKTKFSSSLDYTFIEGSDNIKSISELSDELTKLSEELLKNPKNTSLIKDIENILSQIESLPDTEESIKIKEEALNLLEGIQSNKISKKELPKRSGKLGALVKKAYNIRPNNYKERVRKTIGDLIKDKNASIKDILKELSIMFKELGELGSSHTAIESLRGILEELVELSNSTDNGAFKKYVDALNYMKENMETFHKNLDHKAIFSALYTDLLKVESLQDMRDFVSSFLDSISAANKEAKERYAKGPDNKNANIRAIFSNGKRSLIAVAESETGFNRVKKELEIVSGILSECISYLSKSENIYKDINIIIKNLNTLDKVGVDPYTFYAVQASVKYLNILKNMKNESLAIGMLRVYSKTFKSKIDGIGSEYKTKEEYKKAVEESSKAYEEAIIAGESFIKKLASYKSENVSILEILRDAKDFVVKVVNSSKLTLKEKEKFILDTLMAVRYKQGIYEDVRKRIESLEKAIASKPFRGNSELILLTISEAFYRVVGSDPIAKTSSKAYENLKEKVKKLWESVLSKFKKKGPSEYNILDRNTLNIVYNRLINKHIDGEDVSNITITIRFEVTKNKDLEKIKALENIGIKITLSKGNYSSNKKSSSKNTDKNTDKNTEENIDETTTEEENTDEYTDEDTDEDIDEGIDEGMDEYIDEDIDEGIDENTNENTDEENNKGSNNEEEKDVDNDNEKNTYKEQDDNNESNEYSSVEEASSPSSGKDDFDDPNFIRRKSKFSSGMNTLNKKDVVDEEGRLIKSILDSFDTNEVSKIDRFISDVADRHEEDYKKDIERNPKTKDSYRVYYIKDLNKKDSPTLRLSYAQLIEYLNENFSSEIDEFVDPVAEKIYLSAFLRNKVILAGVSSDLNIMFDPMVTEYINRISVYQSLVETDNKMNPDSVKGKDNKFLKARSWKVFKLGDKFRVRNTSSTLFADKRYAKDIQKEFLENSLLEDIFGINRLIDSLRNRVLPKVGNKQFKTIFGSKAFGDGKIKDAENYGAALFASEDTNVTAALVFSALSSLINTPLNTTLNTEQVLERLESFGVDAANISFDVLEELKGSTHETTLAEYIGKNVIYLLGLSPVNDKITEKEYLKFVNDIGQGVIHAMEDAGIITVHKILNKDLGFTDFQNDTEIGQRNNEEAYSTFYKINKGNERSFSKSKKVLFDVITDASIKFKVNNETSKEYSLKPNLIKKDSIYVNGLGNIKVPKETKEAMNVLRQTNFSVDNHAELLDILTDERKLNGIKNILGYTNFYKLDKFLESIKEEGVNILPSDADVERALKGYKTKIPEDKVKKIKGILDEMGILYYEYGSKRGKNLEVNRTIDTLKDFMTRKIKDENGDEVSLVENGVYFNNIFSRDGRIFLMSEGVNPQSNKFHRFLVTPRKASVEIDLNELEDPNSNNFKNLAIATAQAFGVKVDKISPEESVKIGKEIFSIPIDELSNSVYSALESSNSSINIKGMELDISEIGHTLNVILNLQKLDKAKKEKKNKVSLSLVIEIDARTNGAILMQGTTMFLTNSMETLRKGGVDFFSNNPTSFLKDSGGDLYEDTASFLSDYLSNSSEEDVDNSLKAIIKTHGKLSVPLPRENKTELARELNHSIHLLLKEIYRKENGKVTSKGRNLAKSVTQIFNYGSSSINTTKALGSEILDYLQEAFNKHIKGEDSFSIGEKKVLSSLYKIINNKDVKDFSEVVKYFKEVNNSRGLQKTLLYTKSNSIKNKGRGKEIEDSTLTLGEYFSEVFSSAISTTIDSYLRNRFPLIQEYTQLTSTINNEVTELVSELYETRKAQLGREPTLKDIEDILKEIQKIIPGIQFSIQENSDINFPIYRNTNRRENKEPFIIGLYKEKEGTLFKKTDHSYRPNKFAIKGSGAASPVIVIHQLDGAQLGLSAIQESKNNQGESPFTPIHDAQIRSFYDSNKGANIYNKNALELTNKIEALKGLLKNIDKGKEAFKELSKNKIGGSPYLSFARLNVYSGSVELLDAISSVNRTLAKNSSVVYNNFFSGPDGAYIKKGKSYDELTVNIKPELLKLNELAISLDSLLNRIARLSKAQPYVILDLLQELKSKQEEFLAIEQVLLSKSPILRKYQFSEEGIFNKDNKDIEDIENFINENFSTKKITLAKNSSSIYNALHKDYSPAGFEFEFRGMVYYSLEHAASVWKSGEFNEEFYNRSLDSYVKRLPNKNKNTFKLDTKEKRLTYKNMLVEIIIARVNYFKDRKRFASFDILQKVALGEIELNYDNVKGIGDVINEAYKEAYKEASYRLFPENNVLSDSYRILSDITASKVDDVISIVNNRKTRSRKGLKDLFSSIKKSVTRTLYISRLASDSVSKEEGISVLSDLIIDFGIGESSSASPNKISINLENLTNAKEYNKEIDKILKYFKALAKVNPNIVLDGIYLGVTGINLSTLIDFENRNLYNSKDSIADTPFVSVQAIETILGEVRAKLRKELGTDISLFNTLGDPSVGNIVTNFAESRGIKSHTILDSKGTRLEATVYGKSIKGRQVKNLNDYKMFLIKTLDKEDIDEDTLIQSIKTKNKKTDDSTKSRDIDKDITSNIDAPTEIKDNNQKTPTKETIDKETTAKEVNTKETADVKETTDTKETTDKETDGKSVNNKEVSVEENNTNDNISEAEVLLQSYKNRFNSASSIEERQAIMRELMSDDRIPIKAKGKIILQGALKVNDSHSHTSDEGGFTFFNSSPSSFLKETSNYLRDPDSIDRTLDFAEELDRANGNGVDPEYRENIRKVTDAIKETIQTSLGENVNIVFSTYEGSQAKGRFIHDNSTIEIFIPKKALAGGATTTEIVAHEMAHAALDFALTNEKLTNKFMRNMTKIYTKVISNISVEKIMDYIDVPSEEVKRNLAQQIFDHIQIVRKNGKSNPKEAMKEFAVMSVTNKALINILKDIPIDGKEYSNNAFVAVIQAIVEALKDMWNAVAHKEIPPENYYQAVMNLNKRMFKVNQAIKNGVYKKTIIGEFFSKLMDKALGYTADKTNKLFEKWDELYSLDDVEELLKSDDMVDNMKGYSILMAKITVNPDKRSEYLIKFNKYLYGGHEGMLSTLIDEMSSLTGMKHAAELLQSRQIRYSAYKEHIRSSTIKYIEDMFDNKLTPKTKEELSYVVIFSDISSLSKAHIEKILDGSSSIDSVIEEIMADISEHSLSEEQKKALEVYTDSLAYFIINKESKDIATLVNAQQIGIALGKSSAEFISLIDKLTTLKALKGLDSKVFETTKELMKNHKEAMFSLIQFQKNNTFRVQNLSGESNISLPKGHLKQPSSWVEIEYSFGKDEETMLRKGFVKVKLIDKSKDIWLYVNNSFSKNSENFVPTLIYNDKSSLYRGHTLRSIYNNKINEARAKGASDKEIQELQEELNSMLKREVKKHNYMHAQAYKGKHILRKEGEPSLSPIYNGNMEIVDFMMNLPVVDKVLYTGEVPNVVKSIAHSSSDLIDIINAEAQNYAVINVLYEDYKRALDLREEINKKLGITSSSVAPLNHNLLKNLSEEDKAKYYDLEDFVELSEESTDKYIREVYDSLPSFIKKFLKETYKDSPVMVRRSSFKHFFGYTLLDYRNTKGFKDGKYSYNNMIVFVQELFTKLAGGAKAEIVQKMPSVIIGNIVSNISMMCMYGMSPIKAIDTMVDAVREKAEYDRIKNEITSLIISKSLGKQIDENKLKTLQSLLKANKVNELIDAGLFTSILDDIESSDIPKDMIDEYFNKAKSNMSENGRAVFDFLWLTKDNPVGKALFNILQNSDFISRYGLFNKLTEIDKMSKDKAIEVAREAFINYNTPSHRTLDGLNRFGFLWFTKYSLRVQKALSNLMNINKNKKYIAPFAATAGITSAMNIPSPIDSFILNKDFTNNITSPVELGEILVTPSILEWL